jgi:hypothetical protein
MRLLPLFLCLASATIKNYRTPVCQDCIHYRPNPFSPSLSKCSQFGTKNVITGEITYDYADLSRDNSEKCGLEGKYFNETSLTMKAIQYIFINELPIKFLIALFFFSFLSKTSE